MTSWKIFTSVIVCLVMLFILSGAFLIGGLPGQNYFRAKRVSYAVGRLPVGSSNAQVVAFLKAEGLEYSYIGDEEGIDSASAVRDNGYTSADLSGYIVAIIRRTSWGIVYSDLQLFFFFNKKGKLLKATAEEALTGL